MVRASVLVFRQRVIIVEPMNLIARTDAVRPLVAAGGTRTLPVTRGGGFDALLADAQATRHEAHASAEGADAAPSKSGEAARPSRAGSGPMPTARRLARVQPSTRPQADVTSRTENVPVASSPQPASESSAQSAEREDGDDHKEPDTSGTAPTQLEHVPPNNPALRRLPPAELDLQAAGCVVPAGALPAAPGETEASADPDSGSLAPVVEGGAHGRPRALPMVATAVVTGSIGVSALGSGPFAGAVEGGADKGPQSSPTAATAVVTGSIGVSALGSGPFAGVVEGGADGGLRALRTVAGATGAPSVSAMRAGLLAGVVEDGAEGGMGSLPASGNIVANGSLRVPEPADAAVRNTALPLSGTAVSLDGAAPQSTAIAGVAMSVVSTILHEAIGVPPANDPLSDRVSPHPTLPGVAAAGPSRDSNQGVLKEPVANDIGSTQPSQVDGGLPQPSATFPAPTAAVLRAFGIRPSSHLQFVEKTDDQAMPADTPMVNGAMERAVLAFSESGRQAGDQDATPGRRQSASFGLAEASVVAAAAFGVPSSATNAPVPMSDSTTTALGRAPGTEPPLAGQVVKAIALAWRDGVGEARIRLTPEHLGEVVVSLKVERGAVTVALQADTPLARAWIETHQEDLRQALADQGLQLGRLVVTSEGERQRQQQPDEGSARQRRPGLRPPKAGGRPRFEVSA